MADSDRKLEVLEDELKLLKGEVKKTLVDLRAFIMKEDSPIHDQLEMGRNRRPMGDQPAGDGTAGAGGEVRAYEEKRMTSLEEEIKILRRENLETPRAHTLETPQGYAEPQVYPQAPMAPPWAGMPGGYMGAAVPPLPQAPAQFPLQVGPAQPDFGQSPRTSDPSGQYPADPGLRSPARPPVIEEAPRTPTQEAQPSRSVSPEGEFHAGQAQFGAPPVPQPRRPSARPPEAPVEQDDLGREFSHPPHQSNGYVSLQTDPSVAPLNSHDGTGGAPSLDMNLLASLVRWVSMAKSRLGQQGLMDLAELYTCSCRESPGLVRLVTQIGGMVDEGEPAFQEDAAFEVLDLLQQLHGILTVGSTIAFIPPTGLGSGDSLVQITARWTAGAEYG